jgi:hypothetical protein
MGHGGLSIVLDFPRQLFYRIFAMLYHFHRNVVLNLSASLQNMTARIARFLLAAIMSQSPPNIGIWADRTVVAIAALIQIKSRRLNGEHSPTRHRLLPTSS